MCDIYLIFKSAQKKVGGVLKYFTLGRATKMAALLYLFFNNPPNKKKKKIPLHKKWLTILFQNAPPSSFLYLSPSLLLPPLAPPPSSKNVHIVTREKRGVWLHVSYIVSCLFLFCLPPPSLPHTIQHHPPPPPLAPSSLFFLSLPPPPLFFFISFSLSLCLSLFPPKSGSVTKPTHLPRCHCHFFVVVVRSHATTLAFRPALQSPDTNLSNMATLYSPEPPPSYEKKYFGAAAAAAARVRACVCERACVWVLGRDRERGVGKICRSHAQTYIRLYCLKINYLWWGWKQLWMCTL